MKGAKQSRRMKKMRTVKIFNCVLLAHSKPPFCSFAKKDPVSLTCLFALLSKPQKKYYKNCSLHYLSSSNKVSLPLLNPICSREANRHLF